MCVLFQCVHNRDKTEFTTSGLCQIQVFTLFLLFCCNMLCMSVTNGSKGLSSMSSWFNASCTSIRPSLHAYRHVPFHECFCYAVQEESESQCQQEEGQPEGPATSRPLDPSWGDGDEEHGESAERCPIWTRLTYPVLPGPPTGCTQPIRKSDWQQEQPLRYFRGIMLKRFLISQVCNPNNFLLLVFLLF